MQNTVKVLRDSTKVFTSQFAVLVYSLAISIYLVRTLSKIELSILPVVGLLTGICETLAGLGMVTSCIRLVPKLLFENKKDEGYSIIKTTFIASILALIIFSVIVFIGSEYIAIIIFKNKNFSNIVKWMVPAIFLGGEASILMFFLRSLQEFNKVSIISFLGSFLRYTLIIPLFWLLNLRGMILALTIGPLFNVLIILFYLRGVLFSKGPYSFKWLIRFSLPYYGNHIVRFLTIQADSILVSILLTPELLATYFVAKKFPGYIRMIIKSIASPLTPKISEIKSKGIQNIEGSFSKSLRYATLFFFPLCLSMAALSYFALDLYAGIKYLDSYPVFAILCFSMLALAIYTVFKAFLIIMAEPADLFKIELLMSIVNLALTAFFIQFFGLLGVPLGGVLTFSMGIVLSLWVLKKTTELKVKLDLKFSAQVLAAVAIAAIPLVILQIAYYRLVMVPLYILLSTIIFACMIRKIFTKDDKNLVVSFFPSKLQSPVRTVMRFWLGHGDCQKP